MATAWPHFLSDPDNQEQPPLQSQDIFRSSSSAVVSPTNFDLLRTLSNSTSTSPNMASSSTTTTSSQQQQPPQSNVTKENYHVATTEPSRIPRRNLMEAFEELHIKPTASSCSSTTVDKAAGFNSLDGDDLLQDKIRPPVISPTGVTELTKNDTVVQVITPERPQEESFSFAKVPSFYLPTDLRRDLSDALVNRVSFYAVVHDINKEATSMAANDDSGYNRNPEDMREEYDPLIVAVSGPPAEALKESPPIIKVALIDEERWLLDAIDSRSKEESRFVVNACPPTFLQAMGEQEYENPLASLSNGSRTQLWKPSRSWWEAKSGKNPWIEPKSHNKRWRYLWPLIHYHKFLAKCIKKLKRNGVDVKTSVSPVSVFLREEVCEVSDHLASVSLFDSDKWMACLEHFNGWISDTEEAESCIRTLVSQLKLRPLAEPGDVDSPLLRSQIDKQYLRAMAQARAQMAGNTEERNNKNNKAPTTRIKNASTNKSNKSSFDAVKLQDGHPQVYSKQSVSPNTRPPLHVNGSSPAHFQQQQQPLWGYPPQPGQWWGNHHHWNGHAGFVDDASVHSGISDGFPQHFDMAYGGPVQQPQYYPMMYPQHHPMSGQPASCDPTMQDMYAFNPPPQEHWGHSVGHSQQQDIPAVPGTPGAPTVTENSQAFMDHHASPTQQMNHQVPMSPYWGHLDHATLAMMGIATPSPGASSPQTPAKTNHLSPDEVAKQESDPSTMSAQPLLLRQQYYGFGYGAREGYGPPSPATQFMMSPQANFAYNYGYGVSPRKSSSHRKRDARNGSNPPADSKNTIKA